MRRLDDYDEYDEKEKKRGVLSKIISNVSDLFTERGISNVVLATILFLFFLSLGAGIHELGHSMTAAIYGCEYSMESDVFTGATSISCNYEGEQLRNTIKIIALAGPLLAFVLGTYLYFLEDNGIVRVNGALMWLYSVIPSLYPLIPNSDMSVAIQNGFSSTNGWIMFFIITGFCAYNIFTEIIDQKWLI